MTDRNNATDEALAAALRARMRWVPAESGFVSELLLGGLMVGVIYRFNNGSWWPELARGEQISEEPATEAEARAALENAVIAAIVGGADA